MGTSAYIASTGFSAYASYREGLAQQEQAKAQEYLSLYNARVAEQNARMTEARTNFEQIRQQRRGGQVMGRLRARLGASGAVMSEGAPLALMIDQASELALENALIGFEGRTQAGRWRSQGRLSRVQATIFREKGKNAMDAAYMNVGSTLLTGFSKGQQQGMW